MKSFTTLTYETTGRIARITLNRPEGLSITFPKMLRVRFCGENWLSAGVKACGSESDNNYAKANNYCGTSTKHSETT